MLQLRVMLQLTLQCSTLQLCVCTGTASYLQVLIQARSVRGTVRTQRGLSGLGWAQTQKSFSEVVEPGFSAYLQ